MKKNIIITALTAFVVTAVTLFAFVQYYPAENKVRIEHVDSTPANATLFAKNNEGDFEALDFSAVADKVIDGVVHIRSTVTSTAGNYQQAPPDPFRFFDDDLFERFFGPQFKAPQQRNYQMPPRVGTGSGVIFDSNGYIVTNNHVVKGATDVEVTLNDNRTFKADIIGVDPTTDLAVLKIDAEDLTTLGFENSDNVKVGQWVLAIGNPFNLNSTVTAGIVSAKARNINILREQYAVESFIQTDAAINPGNSGGALVDLAGRLVGINTAIASPTGAYSGYGFAVPANIVKKVVEDLIEYGSVQRGYLGVMIRNVNSSLAEEMELKVNSGVLINSIMGNSAAGKAGVEEGDVVVAVDGKSIQQSNELQERIARKRPGDEVVLTVDRQGKQKDITVLLDGLATDDTSPILAQLGISIEELDDETLVKNGIDHGVAISQILPGKLSQQTGIREGFIVTHIDKQPVKNKEDFERLLEDKKGGVLIEGKYPGRRGTQYYAFGIEG